MLLKSERKVWKWGFTPIDGVACCFFSYSRTMLFWSCNVAGWVCRPLILFGRDLIYGFVLFLGGSKLVIVFYATSPLIMPIWPVGSPLGEGEVGLLSIFRTLPSERGVWIVLHEWLKLLLTKKT